MALRASVRAFTLGATIGSGLVGVYLLDDLRRAGDAVSATISATQCEVSRHLAASTPREPASRLADAVPGSSTPTLPSATAS